MFIKVNFFIIFTSLLSLLILSQEVEEIIVQGEFRKTLINKNDSSIFVIQSEDIEFQPIKHFQQLSYQIPNLNYAASDSRARYFQIRGIGERSGYQGTPNSSVGFIIDDIDYSGQGGIATTFDVEQVEIYMGPQGSRTGANSLAGLIYIQTKDPTEKFEGISELTIGDYGAQNLGIAFGGPLKNKDLRYRLVLRTDYSDGFRKNIFLNKSDTSRKNEHTFRLKLDWSFSNNTEIKFLISQVDLDDPADIWTLDNSLNTLSDRPGMDSQQSNSYGMKIFKNFKNFDLQTYSSITNTDVEFSYDADWGNTISHFPYTYDYFSETLRKRDTFSNEIRFLSKRSEISEKNFEWVLGLNHNQLEETNLTTDDGVYGDPSDPNSPYKSQYSIERNYKSKNISLFGNIDYFIYENYKMALGFRLENWNSNYNDSNDERFKPKDKMSGGKISIVKNNFEKPNIYFSIARGFKQGGFNLGLDQTDKSINELLIYEPEYLTNFEIGMTSPDLVTNYRYAIVLFYSERTNQQVLISRQIDPTDPNTFSYLTQNAAEGKNYGIEFNSDYRLSENLSIYANLGILKTKIINWDSREDLKNRSQAHAPEKSFSLGMNLDLKNNLYLRLNLNGKSSFYYSNSHNNKSDDYQLMNFSFGYKKENINAEFWIRNILDEYYSTRGFYFGNEPPNFIDTLYRRQGDPRHLGISIRYKF